MKKIAFALVLVGGIFFSAKAQTTGQQPDQSSNSPAVNQSNRNSSNDKTPTTRNPAPVQTQPAAQPTRSTPLPGHGQQQHTPDPAINNSNRSSGKATPY